LRENPPARGELLSVRGFPIGNRQGAEDPYRLRSKRFIGPDSISGVSRSVTVRV